MHTADKIILALSALGAIAALTSSPEGLTFLVNMVDYVTHVVLSQVTE